MSLKNTVKALLDEAGNSALESGFFHQEIGDNYGDDDTDELSISLNEAGITFECVDSYGGEGQGENFYTVYVFKLGDETCFVKFQGWYQSYNGSEMTDWAFVTPKTIEVVVYE